MRAALNSLSPISRVRYAVEGAAWAIAYGVVIGALWFGADLAGPYLRSLG